MTTASICTIGDEILIGQIVDTNSAVISQELGRIGVRVREMISVGDIKDEIAQTIENELKKSNIVIVTGGLGPTKDDVTKSVLYDLSCSSRYVMNDEQLDIIHQILSSRGLDVMEINRRQASVPENCRVIPNRLGTAPVMSVRFPREKFGHEAVLYSMPGVPFETKGALPDVMSDIMDIFALSVITHRTVMTYGIAESALAEKISEWEDALPGNIRLAYLPDPLKGVALRLSVYENEGRKSASELIEEQLRTLRSVLKDDMYSENGETLQEVVGKLLRTKGKTVSTAESCTGGLIASLLTSVPGASDYYLGSVVSYAVSVKENVLGVPAEIIDKYGVVSSECVAAMAEGVRKLTGSDYSVATSGVAGPGGGSESTPVGLVWVGVSSAAETKTMKFNFRNDRLRNIERFAGSALDGLRRFIKG